MKREIIENKLESICSRINKIKNFRTMLNEDIKTGGTAILPQLSKCGIFGPYVPELTPGYIKKEKRELKSLIRKQGKYEAKLGLA